LSQRPFAHVEQAAPPAPHCDADSEAYTTHVLLLQQPFGHDVASHAQAAAPLVHSSPAPHDPHAAPPAPQEPLVCDAYGTQTLLLQHPFGHEAASQTH
jgi:hypothetical protein